MLRGYVKVLLIEKGEPKRFRNWKNNKNTDELIDTVSGSARISADRLLIVIEKQVMN